MDATSINPDVLKLEEALANPLYIHLNESPLLQLTTSIFIVNNFHS